MTLDPGHFHAALVHGEMYPAVAPRVDIFAPVGTDLVAHLHRLAAFNRRGARPTSWAWEVHAAPDFFARMLRERPGNVVVLSGRNRDKIGRILASIEAGLHVLADKPWVLQSSDLPQLEAALAKADAGGLVAYDIMTERFEATHAVQRALVNDAATFGRIEAGDVDAPAVYMESVHYLKKMVAGAPNIRPTWFFDTAEQGEGLNDVGTHLVDLVQWTLFPGDAIQPSDIQLLDARRWPTRISESDFRSVTNAPGVPVRALGRGRQRPLRLLLQHAGVLHAAGRAHEVEHRLGLGAAGCTRGYALRVLPRDAVASRGQADERGRVPTRVVRGSEQR